MSTSGRESMLGQLRCTHDFSAPKRGSMRVGRMRCWRWTRLWSSSRD